LSQRALSGGLALQYALHDLDWERWLAGEAAAISAQEAHTNPEIDIEDNLWALDHLDEALDILKFIFFILISLLFFMSNYTGRGESRGNSKINRYYADCV
jgi:predicted dehydrogenase